MFRTQNWSKRKGLEEGKGKKGRVMQGGGKELHLHKQGAAAGSGGNSVW